MKTTLYRVSIEFGDCDPAGIVWFPNFFRWIDNASRHFFTENGVPRWEETARTIGVIGTPLVDTHTRFVKTATYGEELVVATHVSEWRAKTFTQVHRVTRPRSGAEDDLICEGSEIRAFVRRDADDPDRLRAMPVPEDIRALCS